jgi:hypothetical protein
MKRTINKIFLSSFIGSIFALGLSPMASAAGTATLSLTSSSYTVNKGSTLAVNVYEDSGSDPVNGVQVNFSYPTASFSYTSMTTGSSWGIQAQNSGGNGVVKIALATGIGQAGLTGKQLVATVYFSVTGGSGTASMDFDQSSCKVTKASDSSLETLSYQNATYTLNTPAIPPPPPPPPPTTSPKPSGSGGSGGSASTSTKKPTGSTGSTGTTTSALTISGITADNLSANSATIHWTTNRAASSEVDYGQTTIYGLTAVDNNLSTSHSVNLDSKNLKPGVYHFRVKSVDANGQTAQSNDMTFDTSDGSISFNQSAAKKSSASKTAAIAAVAAIIVVVLAGAVAIQKMHRRAMENQELASHVATAPGTAVINGKVTVTPDPKQVPPNTNQPGGPQVG